MVLNVEEIWDNIANKGIPSFERSETEYLKKQKAKNITKNPRI